MPKHEQMSSVPRYGWSAPSRTNAGFVSFAARLLSVLFQLPSPAQSASYRASREDDGAIRVDSVRVFLFPLAQPDPGNKPDANCVLLFPRPFFANNPVRIPERSPAWCNDVHLLLGGQNYVAGGSYRAVK